MSGKSLLAGLVGALLSLALASGAFAVPVTGSLNITGSLVLTAASVTFVPGGQFSIDPVGQTGSFVLLAGTSGSALPIPTAAGPAAIDAFLTFAAQPVLQFDLTALHPGVFGSAACGAAPAAGQTCTPVGSILSLVNTGVGSVALFTLEGLADNFGDSAAFAGTYTTQFSTSYQALLATLAVDGAVTASYSANFTVETPAPVPEPASLLLLGTTLAGTGLATWRRCRGSAPR